MKFHIYTFLAILFFSSNAASQITPAPPQTQTVMITGGTIHVGNGAVIEEGVVVLENGKITAVGESYDGATNGVKVIDAKGKHIYPGFIAMASTLGLIEVGAVRSTRDNFETGTLNPHVRTIIAYNTDSKVIPTVRSNGTLLAQIVPSGGRISGSSSAVRLDAWNWEDAVVATDEGVVMNWPRAFERTGWWAEPGTIKKNKKYAEQVKQIEDFLKDAVSYSKNNSKERNLRLEAMLPLLEGKSKLYVRANNAKVMMEAVLMCERFGIEAVIVGARDSWMITEFLKEKNVSVVLRELHNLPGYKDSDIDQPFKTAAALSAAGINFAISYQDYWQVRNLPFQAGQAVPFGLSKEQALESITLAPAKILGISTDYGSIETGKSATLFISEGDALDMRGNKVIDAWIDGRAIDLDNLHERLARKYQMKYNQR